MTASEYYPPAWQVFGPCRRCGAADGAPCRDLRGEFAVYPSGNRLRNPHKGRKKVRN